MASNPPFQVEDTIDDDFFDNLVISDDDADYNVKSSTYVAADGNDSDDANLFANLSLNDDVSTVETGNVDDVLVSSNSGLLDEVVNEPINVVGKELVSDTEPKDVVVSSDTGLLDSVVNEPINVVGNELVLSDSLTDTEPKDVLVSSNSGLLDKVVNELNNVVGNEMVDESSLLVNNNNGVGKENGGVGVKEVDWSVFHGDSEQAAGNEFGTYTDLFGEVESVKNVDPFENLDAGVKSVDASAVVEKSAEYAQNENVIAGNNVNGEDLTSSQYWESQYPGWKYDSNTGQWYQVESSDTVTSLMLNTDSTITSNLESSVSSNSGLLDNVVHGMINVEKSGNELVSSESSEFEKLVCEDSLPDTNVVSNNGVGDETGVLGVKEVDWSVFRGNSSEQAAGNGSASYSEFFGGVENVNASDPFENLLGNSSSNGPQVTGAVAERSTDYVQNDNVAVDYNANGEDLTSSQYWESQYPGWKYDPHTGQWYQVDISDAVTSVALNTDSTISSNLEFSKEMTDVSYLQQGLQSAAGSVAETSTIQNVTSWDVQSVSAGSVAEMSTVQDVTSWDQVMHVVDSTEKAKDWNQVSEMGVDTVAAQTEWNQVSQDNNGYPQSMVFDPQYPGWYYDTILQEWRTMESYNASLTQSATQIRDQTYHTEYVSTDVYSQNNVQNKNNQKAYDGYGQGSSFVSQDFGKQAQDQNWVGPGNSLNNQASTWKPDAVVTSLSTSGYNVTDSHGGQNYSVTGRSEQSSIHHGANGSYYENVNQVQNNFFMPSQSQGFVVGDNSRQYIPDSRINQNEQKQTTYGTYSNQNSFTFSQPEFQNAPILYAHASGRSSAGRPANALVSFGFGGKLIVMKHNSQNTVGSSPTVLNLAEVVTDASNHGVGTCNYFQALGRQSVPGPLTGGSVGTKELNKWIDERVVNPGSLDVDYRKAEVLKLLLSLLKIACQYYGKLRSPLGSDAALKETDAPESAVAKLFALAKDNVSQFSQCGAQCLQQMPSEAQMQVAATKVQSLLVYGRKKEALQCAQDGQLWGPAVVLAVQLGDQFYVETIKQMALHQLVAGSPLRTLCLLIAGQPAEVFPVDSTTSSSMPGYANMPQQPVQIGASGMLDDWEENMAVITANRTKDDELVLIHFGDCLWKERSNIIAAHICYLVAEASFEPYSDSARLCLVGADHWKSPRTYASPEAIQRTEIYEYSKALGNSQFVILPFQPYKLVYAHMLAEVGRISDALKYAQAVLKSLKTGRSPEVEILKNLASSLEERIKTYQQGGFSTNLAPSKLVGKLLNLFDNTAARVVGGLPPHVPTAAANVQGAENHYQPTGSKVSSSQSTLAMSSLVPSQSTEPINEWASDQGANYSRSVSEPNFGRNPRQTDSEKEASYVESKASTSRLGRFGFGSQILQKTVGLVLTPRQGKQAKLGDTNKFYYDKKLKRWVEDGAESPAEQTAPPPPPPTTAVFQNGTPEYNLKSAMQNEAAHFNGSPEIKTPGTLDNQSGMPPLPTTMNQYSARGRMGVRSRYVDTFNKGGGNSTNLFQSPSASNIKPANAAKPTFFMPTTPISTPEQQPVDSTSSNGMQEDTYSNTYGNSTPSSLSDSSQSHTHPSSSMTMHRFPSMNNISHKEVTNNGSFSVNSRRTASWSGFNYNLFTPNIGEVKPAGEVFGTDAPLGHSRTSSGSFGDDLQHVEF